MYLDKLRRKLEGWIVKNCSVCPYLSRCGGIEELRSYFEYLYRVLGKGIDGACGLKGYYKLGDLDSVADSDVPGLCDDKYGLFEKGDDDV
jgi:hypothetical protein